MHYLDYNEKKQHGTTDFPIAYYPVDEHHPRYNMPFHWHKELEIIRVLAGVLHMTLDDEEIAAQAGDILFINEGIIHGGTPVSCVYECIVFDIQLLLMHTSACKRYIRQITQNRVSVFSHFTRDNPAFCSTTDQLFLVMREKSPGHELFVMGRLFELFGIIYQDNLYQDSGKNPKIQGKMTQLKPVLEYIDSCYDKPITLDQLSRIAGMSSKYFCRYFYSIIHRTPIDYLNYYRIERACYELNNFNITVSEAAYRCGFHDDCYFIKTFKKYKGMTPRQYRLNA